MTIDAGFDMVPRLTTGPEDKQKWKTFIDSVKEYYEDDEKVEIKANSVLFKAGEHPMLPFEGHKLLRFSSQISGSHAEGMEAYIFNVTAMAKIVFGSQVHVWNKARDLYGHYGWEEVSDSIDSYEKHDELADASSTAGSAIHRVATEVMGPPSVALATAGLISGRDVTRETPLFAVMPIVGKGNGLVAHVNIPKGTRILFEQPLFTLPNMPSELLESAVASKLKSLSKDKQRQFLSLHNNFPGKYPFSGIMRTNALPCGSMGGVYPNICSINHSCLPNAHNNWNEEKKHETIHALRDIAEGEEITIPYIETATFTAQKAELKSSFGFDCSCKMCSLTAAELQASEARRTQIKQLDQSIGNAARMMSKPGAALSDCRKSLQILEEEYEGTAAPLHARAYYDAFQVSIAHGDQARAAVFAGRAHEARVTSAGADSPEAERMKKLQQTPANHPSFGYSTRWKTKKDSMPKGLSDAEFEKWLWRLDA